MFFLCAYVFKRKFKNAINKLQITNSKPIKQIESRAEGFTSLKSKSPQIQLADSKSHLIRQSKNRRPELI